MTRQVVTTRAGVRRRARKWRFAERRLSELGRAAAAADGVRQRWWSTLADAWPLSSKKKKSRDAASSGEDEEEDADEDDPNDPEAAGRKRESSRERDKSDGEEVGDLVLGLTEYKPPTTCAPSGKPRPRLIST